MKLYLGITDYDWYSFLAARHPDEVNFWRPSPKQAFRVLDTAGLFLFKLKAPHNAIAGGGFFQRYARLPVSLAWEAFRKKNGVSGQEELLGKIRGYRSEKNADLVDPEIGCIILVQPFFFPEADWIPVPHSFSANLVQGKGYDTSEPDGRALWDAVTDRLARYPFSPSEKGEPAVIVSEPEQYGEPTLIRPRLGQGLPGRSPRSLQPPMRPDRREDASGPAGIPHQTIRRVRTSRRQQRPPAAKRPPPPLRPRTDHRHPGAPHRSQRSDPRAVAERTGVLRAPRRATEDASFR